MNSEFKNRRHATYARYRTERFQDTPSKIFGFRRGESLDGEGGWRNRLPQKASRTEFFPVFLDTNTMPVEAFIQIEGDVAAVPVSVLRNAAKSGGFLRSLIQR